MNNKIERDEILDFIAETIINTLKYPKNKSEITYKTNIIWDIGLNSIDFMRLIDELEEKFDFCYKIDNIEMDQTVKKIVDDVIKSRIE